MQKILFPISEKEYQCVQSRLALLVKSMAADFMVEVVTTSKTVYEDIQVKLGESPNVIAKHLETTFLPLSFSYRDNLAKIFIKYTEDLCIPSTGLKMWKTAAFDDFWGHISGCSFPTMKTIDADLVLLPLLSYEDIPTEETDVLYTSIAFTAKETGTPVCGYQLYPVFNGFKLMPKLLDGIIVREAYERQYYLEMGIPEDRLFLLGDQRDIYALSTIEENYKNHMYNDQIEIGREALCVAVLNHSKLRPQIREIFQVIRRTKKQIVICLIKREFVVKDVDEQEIINDTYLDEIKKTGCRFYLVENKSLVPMTMIADVVISPTFISPLEFASKYQKAAWVYNPCAAARPNVNGVRFINHPDALGAALNAAYQEKQSAIGIKDILHRIMQ
ncbi:MAG: hypothetical protein ACE5GK_00885 [Nitrospiria bacterium]